MNGYSVDRHSYSALGALPTRKATGLRSLPVTAAVTGPQGPDRLAGAGLGARRGSPGPAIQPWRVRPMHSETTASRATASPQKPHKCGSRGGTPTKTPRTRRHFLA